MIRLSWIFMVILTLCLGCAHSSRKASVVKQASQSIGFDPKIFQFTSGLRLVIVEDEKLPVVSYQTWVQAGSRDEALGFTGVAHLFEHLMFKNSERYQAKAFLDELEARGAQVNAFTARDHTVYYETFVPELLDRVIELESDRFRKFRITAEALEVEKQVVMEERRLRLEGSPEGRLDEFIWGKVYPYHAYRVPVIGRKEDLFNLDLTGIREFFRRNYDPSRIIVVVVGPVSASDLKQKIEKAYEFEGYLGGARKVQYPDPLQTEERRWMYSEKAFANPKLIYAYQAPSIYEEDAYQLDVLTQILFGSRSAKGYQTLVEKRRLFLSIAASNFTPECPGMLKIEGVVSPQSTPEKAEEALDQFLEEFVANLDQETLDTGIAQLSMRVAEEWQTATGLASSIGLSMSVFNDPKRFEQDLKKYQRVTVEDVKRVYKKYMSRERRNLILASGQDRGGAK